MNIYIVYDHPVDYPNYYVARRFEFSNPTGEIFVNDDLEKVRDWIKSELIKQGTAGFRLERHPSDDIVILECWI